MRLITPQILVSFINLLVNLIEGLLGLRIILKLLKASPNAPFVKWIYETTKPLISPFIGIFPSPKLEIGFVIEFSSIFAIVVYAFFGYLATETLNTLMRLSRKKDKDDE